MGNRFRFSAVVVAGKRNRTGIMAAGIFDQGGDPVFHRGMGVEQFAETLARVVDAQFHDCRGRARQFAAAFDFVKRRDHRVGILASSTAPESARYSRCRDSASRIRNDST